MERLLISLLLTGFLISNCPAQDNINDWNFYNYLKSNNNYREALAWLYYYQLSDSGKKYQNKVLFEKAYIFYETRQNDSLNFYLKKCNLTDTPNLYIAMYSAAAEMDTATIKMYFKKFPVLEKDTLLYSVFNDFGGEDYSVPAVIYCYRGEVPAYTSQKRKSPFKAALFSIIPGLGKYYLGFKSQAVSSFIINTVLILALTESLILPAATIYIILNSALASVFYIGNIWGSITIAKKFNKDIIKQINEDISNYFYFKLYSVHR